MDSNRIILPLTPQTWFKSLPQHKVFFQIPEVCRKLKGKKPCHKYRRYGTCKHSLNHAGLLIKRRIQRYNKYKVDVLALATAEGFSMPHYGWSLYFYFPLPKRRKGEERKMLHGNPKISKPDIDNLQKAVFDSLSITDETVAQLSGVGKFWVDTMYVDHNGEKQYGSGWIEILLNQPVYNPMGVVFVDQSLMKAAPKRKWIKREDGDPKKRSKKIAPLKIKEYLIK